MRVGVENFFWVFSMRIEWQAAVLHHKQENLHTLVKKRTVKFISAISLRRIFIIPASNPKALNHSEIGEADKQRCYKYVHVPL